MLVLVSTVSIADIKGRLEHTERKADEGLESPFT